MQFLMNQESLLSFAIHLNVYLKKLEFPIRQKEFPIGSEIPAHKKLFSEYHLNTNLNIILQLNLQFFQEHRFLSLNCLSFYQPQPLFLPQSLLPWMHLLQF